MADYTIDYTIREPAGIEEFAQLVSVFQQVFALTERATPPAWLMEDSVKVGGLAVGLWQGDQAVGFSYAFAGLDAQGPYLYSSGLGVLPGHRSQGQAAAMKIAQRELALERGYQRIRWTYSALRSVNAHLYLTRIGGLGTKYVFDTRGSFDSDWVTEGGVPLDEFAVDWDLSSQRVRDRLDGAVSGGLNRTVLDASPASPCITVCTGEAPRRVLTEIDGAPTADLVICEVPADFQFLVNHELELAHDWRTKTRPAFAELLASGFVLTECVLDDKHGLPYYVFDRRERRDHRERTDW